MRAAGRSRDRRDFRQKFGNARGFAPARAGLYISPGGLIGGRAAMASWTLDDIPWRRFDGAKVEPDILRIVKAASLVEQNGADYAQYLCGVFHDDPAFQQLARRWPVAETQHRQALRRRAIRATHHCPHAPAGHL